MREHMTRQERHLWYDFLQKYPVQFYKQRTIGYYIVDFYCEVAGLIIEVDGSQHYTEKARAYDAERTAFFELYGLKVIRFSNLEVKHAFRRTCATIHCRVQERMREMEIRDKGEV